MAPKHSRTSRERQNPLEHGYQEVKKTLADTMAAASAICRTICVPPPQDAFLFVIVDKAAGTYTIGPTQTDCKRSSKAAIQIPATCRQPV